MREILFRGKLIKHDPWRKSDWIEGSLIDSGNHEQVAIYPWVNGASTMSVRQLVYGRMEGVRHETVGQYTGLNDMNDKRIFEGDIVRCKHVYEDYNGTFEDAKIRRAYGKAFDENTGECIYMRNYAVRMYNGSWELRNGSDAHKINSNYIINHDVEIIGNIHDNPELLEVGGNEYV